MIGYQQLLEKVQSIDPISYGKTRNYTSGTVTKLSPYISRGVIDTGLILDTLVERGYRFEQVERFVQQLAWRDFFQHVWMEKGEAVNADLRGQQQGVRHRMLPNAIAEAGTGIFGVDQGIKGLLEHGYMHNHVRMYTAFLAGNLAGAHWLQPAKWMYYHLLDGDWGSNALSWQWVVGTFSNKKYMANQENINRYTGETQHGTYLDTSYEELGSMDAPEVLFPAKPCMLSTSLPSHTPLKLVPEQPVFVYNYYQLSPTWRAGEKGNRILLLEPALFEQYPVSKACIDFMLDLGKQIPGLQVFVGSFASLKALTGDADIVFRIHPLSQHYTGKADPPASLIQGLDGNFTSFFSYWKRLEKQLRKAFYK